MTENPWRKLAVEIVQEQMERGVQAAAIVDSLCNNPDLLRRLSLGTWRTGW